MGGEIAGHIVCWDDVSDGCWDDEHEHRIDFWFKREYRGRGIATTAIRAFLAGGEHRPLFTEVAHPYRL